MFALCQKVVQALSPGVDLCVLCRGGGVNAVLTVSLCTDEAGGGAVKEGEEAGHSQADVGVGRPQVQSGEAWELNLQDVLWSHLDIGHLHRDISHSFFRFKNSVNSIQMSADGTTLKKRKKKRERKTREDVGVSCGIEIV